MSTQAYSNVSYELESLGWKAFQDLCTTIVSEVLGQTVQAFLPTRDGGRDGAFYGIWTPSGNELLKGSFTVQCKFSEKRNSILHFSHIEDELGKAKKLAAKGLAKNYVLMTNHSVTGLFDEELRTIFLSIPGIENFLVFGNEWITSKIKESSKLRMLVPRVYGLGDLSQILDERAYLQAKYILESLGDDLAKFVITSPHRKSARALVEHGFVLLLGEPASGKSTIAASLAVGAIDVWGCSTLRVADASDFIHHWNPNEPKQFFWIDDAFGTTQYQRSTVDEWNRAFSHLQAAIRKGARVLFTSRDYIFKAAQLDLKLSAFPVLMNSQVLINVHDLSKDEREQMLYNHIKLGNQPSSFKTAMKPFLPAVAANQRFLPEIARRLGDKFFTRELLMNATAVKEFVEEPRSFLRDTLTSLDRNAQAAVALVFMNGGQLKSPLSLDQDQERMLQLFGGTISGVREALMSLNGSILKLVRTDGDPVWTYKHPTVSDAFGSIVADDPELLHLYLLGTPVEKLVREIVCGESDIAGAKVIIGPSLYDTLIKRLESLKNIGLLYYFLAVRCGRSFLSVFMDKYPSIYSQLTGESFVTFEYQDELLIKLFEVGLLPEQIRAKFFQKVSDAAVETPDAAFLKKRTRALFNVGELQQILERIRNELLPNLDQTVWDWKNEYYPPEDVDDHFGPLLESLEAFSDEFSGDEVARNQLIKAIEDINDIIDDVKQSLPEELDPPDYYYEDTDPFIDSDHDFPRSIFDDVDK